MAVLLSIAIFAVLGFGVLDQSPRGLVVGAVIGALVGVSRTLGQRVARLERRLADLERRGRAVDADATPARVPAEAAARRDTSEARVAGRSPSPSSAPAPHTTAAARPRPQPRPAPIEILLGRIRAWLTTGNVPAKVGVLLSIVGIGFLVKEGIDRHWLVLSLGERLALVAGFGVAMLALGWRFKAHERAYGLSLQGGGIAVLYVTTYSAYALYGLLGAPLAFGLLFAVTVGAVLLALAQDARVLAVLGIIGGFLAPLLTATDTGNHVALFGYYALLDVAIFATAWFKAWRSLNVVGFVFTFAVGGLWGHDAYRPELFATTEPFLVLFVLLYLAIPVLFALRQPPELRGFVDGTLVFGTPIIGFGLQAALLADSRYGLASSALALAAIYAASSAYVRRRSAELRVLAEAQLALGVVFLTLALPLALAARWTSAGWALEGAALVWLGLAQQRRLPLLTGVALQIAAGAAYAGQLPAEPGIAWLNGHWLGAVLLAAAGGWSSRLFDIARERAGGRTSLPAAAGALLVWAGGWWLWAGFDEIHRRFAGPYSLAVDLLFVALTLVLALLGAKRLDWRRLAALGLVAWPLAVLLFLVGYTTNGHPGASLGWAAWPVLCAALFVFLRARDAQFEPLSGALHAVAYWLATALLVSEAHWQVARFATEDWAVAGAFAAAAGIVLATLRAHDRAAWPIHAHARLYLGVCCGGVAVLLLLGVLSDNMVLAGNPAPLPYWPLANPLELASALALYAAVRWLAALAAYDPALSLRAPQRAGFAAVFGLALLTMAVARAVHHFAAVPFDFASLARSTVLQASLSLVWGAAGLATMTLGARRAQRGVWLAGAVLMTAVVAKLLVVDLGNAGTVGRIVSFLGVGVLLLIVGYFAPVPPRRDAEH